MMRARILKAEKDEVQPVGEPGERLPGKRVLEGPRNGNLTKVLLEKVRIVVDLQKWEVEGRQVQEHHKRQKSSGEEEPPRGRGGASGLWTSERSLP